MGPPPTHPSHPPPTATATAAAGPTNTHPPTPTPRRPPAPNSPPAPSTWGRFSGKQLAAGTRGPSDFWRLARQIARLASVDGRRVRAPDPALGNGGDTAASPV